MIERCGTNGWLLAGEVGSMRGDATFDCWHALQGLVLVW